MNKLLEGFWYINIQRFNPRRDKLTRRETDNLKRDIRYRLMFEDYTCRLPKPRYRYRLETWIIIDVVTGNEQMVYK